MTAHPLTPLLAPLAPYRDQLLVMSGLTDGPAMPATGEGSGDHVDHVYLQFLTLMRTDDAREGMVSFMQKRAPEFKGR